MASVKFNRRYKLTIGATNTEGSTKDLKESVVLQDSHIEFDVKTTKKSNLNTLELKIYNLSKSTIAVFDTKDVLVTLEVAYGDEPFVLLFKGEKTQMKTVAQPPDIITTVICAEGYVDTREGRVQKTLPEGSTVEDIIKALVKEGFPNIKSVNINGEGTKKKYNKGYSLTGGAKEALDNICNTNNLDWHIEKNDTINVLPKKGDIKVEALVISPNNGLINTPEKTSQKPKKLKDDEEESPDAGTRFQCLLNPLIRAGQVIQIQGTFDSDGNYRVDTVGHKGGYESDEWTTTVEATEY